MSGSSARRTKKQSVKSKRIPLPAPWTRSVLKAGSNNSCSKHLHSKCIAAAREKSMTSVLSVPRIPQDLNSLCPKQNRKHIIIGGLKYYIYCGFPFTLNCLYLTYNARSFPGCFKYYPKVQRKGFTYHSSMPRSYYIPEATLGGPDLMAALDVSHE